MGLRAKLRNAAQLFVELPPEEPESEAREGDGAAAPPPGGAETDDLDRRLAEMNRNIAGLRAGSGGETAPPSPAGAPAAPAGAPSGKTVEQIVREADGPDLGAIEVPASAPPPVVGADGTVDFGAIYGQAGLPRSPFTAEQTLDMLAGLPPELPLETKRQTIKVTLGAMGKAIGATPETIVADASRKLAALAAYSESVAKQTAEFVAAGEFEIAALQAQIEEKRRALVDAQQRQAEVQRLCSGESDRLDDVLEFFSLDIPPSRYAPGAGGGS
jgi:hypothetical protein